MKKRILSLVLAGALCLSLSAPALAAGLDNFQKVNTYTAGQFSDVPADAWFAPNVQAAYELDLMTGSSDTTFNPNGNLTIAEALVLACRLHSTYAGDGETFAANGGTWYQPYVDYAVKNGIITDGAYTDYTATATRAQFAAILAAALPDEALPAINSVTSLPDLDASAAYAAAVLKLYNAGILTGSDAAGSFKPTSTIQRSEVATIVTRMADKSLRKTFTLSAASSTPTTSVSSSVKKFDGMIDADDLQGVWYAHRDPSTTSIVSSLQFDNEEEWIFSGDQFTYIRHSLDNGTYFHLTGGYTVTSTPYNGDANICHVTLNVNYGNCYISTAGEGFELNSTYSNTSGTREFNANLTFPYDCFVYDGSTFTRADSSVLVADFEAASGVDTDGSKVTAPSGGSSDTGTGSSTVIDDDTNYYPVVDNALDYGSLALRYIYTHLKFPSTMEVVDIRHGVYNRSEFFDGAPEFVKPTNTVLSYNKDYYLVVLVIKAANSLGVMTTDTYVCLFDMDSGKSWYDLEGYASEMADGAWGSSKTKYMDLESEALMLGAAIRFRSFTQEEVQTLLASLPA